MTKFETTFNHLLKSVGYIIFYIAPVDEKNNNNNNE
jgi:hypothetical protein